MKPIKIKIKGINSYVSEQEIDFKKLAESNIFGIFGETGSGKTTILDSIILALYGVSDRDSLQNIINVNTKDAYVEYTFEMEDGNGKAKKYFVKRDFHLRPRGLKTEAILNELDKKETIAEMPDNVNNKILEIIGIGKKEFTKCIALPQGEFDRFLSDTPALRKKTLAKLFDLEQFGVILNEKLKNRKNIVFINKAALEEKMSLYQGISQETIDKTEKILKDSDKELKRLELQISRDKKLIENIKSELETKQNLLDMEINLSIKQSELPEINFIQKQIDYTEKYGDYSILNNKYNNCIQEIEILTNTVNENKKLLSAFNDDVKKLDILIENNAEKSNAIEMELRTIELDEERRKLHEQKLDNLQKEKNIFNAKLLDLASLLTTTNNALNQLKSNLVDMNATHKKLENQIFDNMDTLDKLNDCQTFKTKQDFALFLTLTKNKINPESLAEVEDYNIYDEVTSVVHDIENFEIGVRKEISQIMKDLKNLNISSEDIDEVKEELQARNDLLNKKCDELEEGIDKTKENISNTKAKLDSLKLQIDQYNSQLEKTKTEINETLSELSSIKPTTDLAYLTRTLNSYKAEQEKLLASKNKLVAQKQQAVIDVEVNTNNLENYKEKLSMLINALKPYNKATFKNKADSSLLVEYDEIPALKEKVETYHKELNVLESNTLALREKTKDYVYTKEDFRSLSETLDKNEQKISDLKVFINVNKITIDIQKKNLEALLELQKEMDAINIQYKAIEKLESLLSGGALIEFVAEEYMGLITEFANTYVYKISKGKYLLNYDGDFNVIDNFNGGIKRSVKTLSGGERFIVSLSLALGISQSIAVNNNKNFNFFFIDEGFGNLSENYIEKVLQSFDALIRLDFTVGFITHVEKMQYYLNNRIIVTKDNNDEGSKIEQYC